MIVLAFFDIAVGMTYLRTTTSMILVANMSMNKLIKNTCNQRYCHNAFLIMMMMMMIIMMMMMTIMIIIIVVVDNVVVVVVIVMVSVALMVIVMMMMMMMMMMETLSREYNTLP